jgi:hypothetical protein
MKKPHVRARTPVEVYRLFNIHALAKVLTASDDGMLRDIGSQIRSHCVRMLDPYITEQNRLAKAVKERRRKPRT